MYYEGIVACFFGVFVFLISFLVFAVEVFLWKMRPHRAAASPLGPLPYANLAQRGETTASLS